MPKVVENTDMYTESNSRLVLKKLHRSSLVKQLIVLGDALGPNKPASSHVYTDDMSEDEEEDEEELEMLQQSLRSVRRKSTSQRQSTSSMDANQHADASSLRSRSGSAASSLSSHADDARSRLNTATATTTAAAAADDDTDGSGAGVGTTPSVRRPAPPVPAGRGSPRLGRSARRGKRPDRPPDPKRPPPPAGPKAKPPKPPAPNQQLQPQSQQQQQQQQGSAEEAQAQSQPPRPVPRATPKRPPRPAPKTDSAGGTSVERMSLAADGAYKFGSVLDVMANQTGRNVPVIVESCIAAVREDGMKEEGIFRVPGSSLQIDELKEAFESGRDPLANGVPSHIHPSAIAGLLKLFFRQLADPVLCRDNYQLLIQVRKQT